ncbi:four-carbon acid sugar kinase family protein [Mesorhizobium sp. IRAMC:0171]|uniref:Four-carbon acid sugar kinase family protein n=2 Tax=Mesorhizobium retamae TaxID=2912854 RepID=A0ABS9QD76_9HYPH|nr:four-carbon acid sugar kinase family protein [Mesorhizobium sp. IRAMC:0171]MCG7505374.1 four-carbon acid sugar kinase family protein [Mesorhizobium sp. IRAMC:0171]
MTMPALPGGPLLGFYGDDFTGSTAVLEAMTLAGLPAVLFLQAPDAEQLSHFSDCRAIGIAGIARSQNRSWMSQHLPPIYHVLADLGAAITHYKVCSTFDSSAELGSIGHAIDLAAPIFGGGWIPLVVASPDIGRYQTFGNLFALAGDTVHRLDRHPTMAHHPVTPMNEADVRRHLAGQTDRSIGLIDFVAMTHGRSDEALRAERDRGAEIVALDVINNATLIEAGRLIWTNRGARQFAVGSQGLEQALIAYWRSESLLPVAPAQEFHAGPTQGIVCASGSCSPVTAKQIAHAEEAGFELIRLDAALAVDPEAWQSELGRAGDLALVALGAGRSPLMYTAVGPDDPALARMKDAIRTSGTSTEMANERIGAGLGETVCRVMHDGKVARAAIAGGDTSGHAALKLGIQALTFLAPIAPGVPLCLAHSSDPHETRYEVALKGGQMGPPEFFSIVRNGGRAA